MARRALILIVGVLVASPSFAALSAHFVRSEIVIDHSLATVGFNRGMSETEVQQLLNESQLRPQAVYLSMAGLAGTHRSYRSDATNEEFIARARTKSIESFERGLQGNVLRLEAFLASHTVDEVNGDPSLQEQARSLLGIRLSLERALELTKSYGVSIDAIEVRGLSKDVDRLSQDNRVKSFVEGRQGEGRSAGSPGAPLRDSELEARLAGLQHLSSADLYSWISSLAANEGGNR